jgi:threonine synthase
VLDDAFTFPAPLIDVTNAPGRLSVLELFHGPTSAFKDFRRTLPRRRRWKRLPRDESRRITILVATSGDTGGAVAAAFFGRAWVDVVILYPAGLVSERQAQQLACWGRNVRTLRVNGTFDDCQRLVKASFADQALRRQAAALVRPTASTSDDCCRRWCTTQPASLAVWRRERQPANFIVPSGNLGNVLACLWAREVGLPIGHVVMSTNANHNRHRLPAHGSLGAARECSDPRVRDGRGRSE